MTQQVKATARKGGGFTLIKTALPLAPFSAVFIFSFAGQFFKFSEIQFLMGKATMASVPIA